MTTLKLPQLNGLILHEQT